MKRWLKRILRVVPCALLLLSLLLWLSAGRVNSRAVAWWGRYFLFAAAQPDHLEIVAHRDSDPNPLVRPWPYVRVWRFVEDKAWVDSWAGSGVGPPEGSTAPQDYFDQLTLERNPPPTPDAALLGLRGYFADHAAEILSGSLDPNTVALLDVPYWMPALLALLLNLPLAIRLARRWRAGSFQPGHCPSCGYDLRASVSRCPECGTAIDGRAVWRRAPTLRHTFWRINLHIRRHASDIVALTTLLCVVVVIRQLPPRFQVAPLGPHSLDGRWSEGFDPDEATIALNVLDLCRRGPDGTWRVPDDMQQDITFEAGVSPGYHGFVNFNGGVLTAMLARHDLPKLIHAINQRRGVTP